MRSLKIAGIERYPDLEKDTLEIEYALTYEIDSCSFKIKGDKPTEGEEVIIEDADIGRMFAGIIVKVELVRTFPSKTIKVWQVDCDDYTNLLDAKLVVEVYENMSASDIFLDIVAKYCPDFTAEGVQANAPVVESTGTEFDYKRPSECFRWLCDYCGWHWQPDYYKDLQFFSAEELVRPAPMTLVPGGKFRFGKHSIDKQGLRNRVYVKGGKMLSDPQTVEWKTDGVARIWNLPWSPHEVSLEVGGEPKAIGVENLHDEAEYAYMMNFNEKYIRCSSGTSTPVEGSTMSLIAKQDIPVITVVEDYASQQAIKAVQGGDGIYEHVIADDSFTTIQAAEAAGMADLREHANPRVKGNFETEFVLPIEYESPLMAADLIGVPTAPNLLTPNQSSIEENIAGFVCSGGALSRDISEFKFGASSLKFVTDSPESDDGVSLYPTTVVEPSKTYTASLYIKSSRATAINLTLLELAGGIIEYPVGRTTVEINPTTYWKRFSVSRIFGATGTRATLYFAMGEGFADYFYIDGVQLEQGDIATSWILGGESRTQILSSRNWKPGQIVDIQLPDRGVVGEYLIQQVNIRPATKNLWTFGIEYGGRLLGIADFLKALVSAQQKKKSIEPMQIVQKFVYSEDTLMLEDELIITPRDLPYICGDEDAVCGLVVVSSG